MNKKMITKWAFHLLGAICAAGTIALLLTFCSEALFSDRGELDQSLMTWEDFNVTLLNEHHLFWNELDIDLDVASLEEPERFPLISKAS
jgi:hypothetical protein